MHVVAGGVAKGAKELLHRPAPRLQRRSIEALDPPGEGGIGPCHAR
jgi:hypothetical protein